MVGESRTRARAILFTHDAPASPFLLALTGLPGGAQQSLGMASRGVNPIPFGKPSGRPWVAHFAAFLDFDTDCRLDLFKTHFRDVTIRSGLGVETRCACWGAAMADLGNDGLPDLDLFFTTGMVYSEVEQKSEDRAVWRDPASPSRIPAAESRSAISITMATSTSS